MQQNQTITNHQLPDYDFHVSKFLTHPFLAIITSIISGCLWYFLLRGHPVLTGILVGISIFLCGVYLVLNAFVNRYSNLERRIKARDKFLSEIPWQGNETVLDVGCGNGILLMGAAKRLTTGKGIGIDIWTDSSDDSRFKEFQKNAKLEGVTGRVSLQNQDVRQLPYDNESFDVIISGLTMHHISHGKDTKKAMSEMIRVLKPGGRIAIYDVPFIVIFCARLMRKKGLKIEKKNRDAVYGLKP